MFCIVCGTELPNEANFCWKCGKPQNEQANVPEPRYETCEICIDLLRDSVFGKKTYRIYVRAINSKGEYIVAEQEFKSNRVEIYYDDVAKPIHQQMIKQLVQEGWQPTGRGEAFWNDTFRRLEK